MSQFPDFGVQTWCFRETTDPAALAAKVRALGLEQVELCGAHGHFAEPGRFGAAVDALRAGGVSIVSLGVQTFIGDDAEKTWFACARSAGARHISCHFQIGSYLRALPRVRQWSREFGVRVGIHCHGGWSFGGSPDVLDHLLALGGPEIGLCLDTAWAMQIGPYRGNPVEWAKRYAGRIHGVHFKDFVFAPNGQWEDMVLGAGTLDLPAFVRALRDNGFDGVAVIEYEGDPANPEPMLRLCVAAMRDALAGL